MKKQLLLSLFILIGSTFLYSQCDIPTAELTCEEAPVLCNIMDLDGYCTTMPMFSNPSGPSPLCNGNAAPNNTIWFGFVAGSQFIDMTVHASNCNIVGGQSGIQGGLYGGPCNKLTSVVCQSNCTTSAMNLASNSFIPGQVYWFILDGCNGSSCDITVEINSAGSTDIGPLGFIQGPQKTCTIGNSNYNVNPVKNAEYYYWTLNGVEISDPTTEDENITINFDSAGVYQLCVDVANYCVSVDELPAQNCFDITVSESSQTILPSVQICSRDSFYYLGIGYPVGTHDIIYPNAIGCDSIISLQVDSFPIPVTYLDTVYICKGECVSITDTFGNGGNFCETAINKDIYLQSWMGCDSIVNITILRIDLNADLQATKITCKDSTATIMSNLVPTYANNYTLQWTTNNGNIISSSNKENITVNSVGIYCLNMKINGENGSVCFDTMCIEVLFDTVSLDAGYYYTGDSLLRCDNNSLNIVATADSGFTNATWTENNMEFIGDSIKTTKPGILKLVVYGDNGCQSDTIYIEVKSTYTFKDTINVDTIVCQGEFVMIDSILYPAPSEVDQFSENNDTCILTHYSIGVRNQADTLLIRCDDEPLVFFNKNIPLDSLTFTIPITNSTGCDTVWHIKINKASSNEKTLTIQATKGSFYHGVLIKNDTILYETYTNVAGCDSTVTININVPVSSSDPIYDYKIKLVPNPAKEKLTLYSDIVSSNGFDIINSLGQKIISKKSTIVFPYEIDLRSLTSGIYWIRIYNDKEINIISFVKRD